MEKILAICTSILLLSCASSNFTTTSDIKYPEHKGAVKVFFDEPKDVTFDQVGIISAEGSLFGDDVEVIKSLQHQAAKNGANAIIIISAFSGNTIKTEEKDNGVYISTDDDRKMLAMAIRVRSK